jgi:hypothetical protein
MLGDNEDSGTAASRQSPASEIRTDERIFIRKLSELEQGYKADSHSDEDSSEGSFTHTHTHTQVMMTKTQTQD